ncbi:nuclear transcription factor Y subunit A-7-like [Silene latifolia]|uniref:nuclear transcription factor Y subunit A-7-like n=1 Tax=Silene latifolia TaxID=37657 RepID=UPI003D778247
MSSSANDCSDSGEADDQQSHSESISYSTSTMGAPEGLHTASSLPYPVLPHLGAMGQAAYPYPDPYGRSMFAPYDPQAYPAPHYPPQPMVQLQLMGIQPPGLPLTTDAVEEPIFVNAKQYHGILRRRQSRAKAESENKAKKNRKPYLHESRHLHALKRARGCGGRFLNAKKDENQVNATASNNKEAGEKASHNNSQPVCEIDAMNTRCSDSSSL